MFSLNKYKFINTNKKKINISKVIQKYCNEWRVGDSRGTCPEQLDPVNHLSSALVQALQELVHVLPKVLELQQSQVRSHLNFIVSWQV